MSGSTRISATAILLLCSLCAFAQDAPAPGTNGETPVAPPTPAPIDPGYASPSSTMVTFLESMNAYAEALAAENKAAAQRAIAKAVSTLKLSPGMTERGPQLAKRLLLIFNRLGEYQPWHLSDRTQVEGRSEETYFPHGRFDAIVSSVTPKGTIVLSKQPDGRWLFSEATVAGLDELYRSLEPLPLIVGADSEAIAGESWLRAQMPNSLKLNAFITVEYWQWLGLLVLIFLGISVGRISRLIIRTIVTRLMLRRGAEPDPEQMQRFVRPVGLLLNALFWLGTVWVLDLPGTAYVIVHGAARVFAVLATALAIWRLNDLVTDALIRRADRTTTKFDDVVYPMIRTTIRIFIVIFGIIYGGLALNINVWPALTALGIGGVGFAFAAKDTLENFFGSATVLIDKPFGIGDWVVIGDVEGTVEQIGFRSTRVRTFYNSLITVPNANLVRAAVDNYGARRYRRWKCHVGVQYDTSPEKVTAFAEGIRELVRTHPYTRKDYFQVWLNEFAGSSLNILIYVFFETPDWSTELRERERLMLDMMRLADKLGVEFAFPTQTLHLHQADPDATHAPGDSPTSMTDRRAMVEGIRATQDLVANQPWQSEKPGPVEYKHGPTQLDPADDTQIEQRDAGG